MVSRLFAITAILKERFEILTKEASMFCSILGEGADDSLEPCKLGGMGDM
jgi:hypothetical protein